MHTLDQPPADWFATFIENSHDLIQSVGPDGRFRLVNRAWQEALGFTQADLETLTLWDVVAPEQLLHYQALFRSVFAGNHLKNIKTVFRTKDGRLLTVQGNMSPLIVGGEVIATQAFFQDITQQEMIEQIWRSESSERLNQSQKLTTLNQIGQAVTQNLDLPSVLQEILDRVSVLIAAEGVVILLLETPHQLRFAAVSGEGAKGLEGQTMPADQGIVGQAVQTGHTQYVANRQIESVSVYQTAEEISGFTAHTLVAVPLKANDQVIGVIEAVHSLPEAFLSEDLQSLQITADWAAIAINNAHLFQKEQKARHLAEVITAVNLALSQSLDLNVILQTLLGYLAQLIPYDGATVQLLNNEGKLRVKAHQGYDWLEPTLFENILFDIATNRIFEEILTEQKSLIIANTHEHPAWEKSAGSDPIFSWLGVPLIAGGKAIGVYCFDKKEVGFFTADHQHMAQSLAAPAAVAIQNAILYQEGQAQYQQLQESQTQLMQAEKLGALGRLMASFSHEINNPLQAIQGCLTLAVEEMDAGGTRESIDSYLGIVQEELKRIEGLVRRMRDFYTPSSGIMQSTDLHFTLVSVLELVGKQLQHSRIHVQTSWAEDVPIIHGNANHLKQVFLNLILNALDALPQGGTLRIQTFLDKMRLPKYAEMVTAVRIEFADNGKGMSPEAQARLFEPFFTTKEGSSGLGLSISFTIIQNHQGQMTISSEENKGTLVTIWLPVQTANESGS